MFEDAQLTGSTAAASKLPFPTQPIGMYPLCPEKLTYDQQHEVALAKQLFNEQRNLTLLGGYAWYCWGEIAACLGPSSEEDQEWRGAHRACSHVDCPSPAKRTEELKPLLLQPRPTEHGQAAVRMPMADKKSCPICILLQCWKTSPQSERVSNQSPFSGFHQVKQEPTSLSWYGK